MNDGREFFQIFALFVFVFILGAATAFVDRSPRHDAQEKINKICTYAEAKEWVIPACEEEK